MSPALLAAVLILKPRLLSVEALSALARQAGADAALLQLQTRLVTLLAVSEAIALLGFVLFVLGGGLSDFYPLWAASVLGHLALTPRGELWKEVGQAGGRG